MREYRALYVLDWCLRMIGFGLVCWVLVLLVIFLGGCANVPPDPAGRERAVCICILASCDCRRGCDE